MNDSPYGAQRIAMKLGGPSGQGCPDACVSGPAAFPPAIQDVCEGEPAKLNFRIAGANLRAPCRLEAIPSLNVAAKPTGGMGIRPTWAQDSATPNGRFAAIVSGPPVPDHGRVLPDSSPGSSRCAHSNTLMLFWRSGPRFDARPNFRLVGGTTLMSPSTSGLRYHRLPINTY
jgi:hypothetical protein